MITAFVPYFGAPSETTQTPQIDSIPAYHPDGNRRPDLAASGDARTGILHAQPAREARDD